MALLKDLIVTGAARILNDLTVNKIIKSGGTSSLFLKADGSVDSTTYYHSGNKPSYTATDVGLGNVANQGANYYTQVYNSSNIGSSSSVTVNDLAKKGNSAVGMIYAATDNPFGSLGWVHVWSQAWTSGTNTSWTSQIALGVDNSDGMWYRTQEGTCVGAAWKRVIDSSNIGSLSVASATNSTNATNATHLKFVESITTTSTTTDLNNIIPIGGLDIRSYKGACSNTPTALFAGDGEIISIGWSAAKAYGTQIAIGADNTGIAFRHANSSGTYGNWLKLATTSDIPTTLPANGGTATAANYPSGFSGRTTSWTWGTLTVANGYTLNTQWDYSGGAAAFATKSNQTSMLLDGFFYLNEGAYRVLDTSNAHASTSRNNSANKLVTTDASGYIQAGWINTTSGGFNGAITGINKIYCSEDNYIRYLSPSDFISALNLVTTNTALTISGAKTFSQAINADILGNATTADRLKNDVAGTAGSGWQPCKIEGGVIKYYNNLYSSSSWNYDDRYVSKSNSTITYTADNTSYGLLIINEKQDRLGSLLLKGVNGSQLVLGNTTSNNSGLILYSTMGDTLYNINESGLVLRDTASGAYALIGSSRSIYINGTGLAFLNLSDNAYSTVISAPTATSNITLSLPTTSGTIAIMRKQETASSGTTFTILPNILYDFGKRTTLNITFGAATSNIVNEYTFLFYCENTATTLTMPSSITWKTAPSIKANKKYEVSVVNNLGVIIEF